MIDLETVEEKLDDLGFILTRLLEEASWPYDQLVLEIRAVKNELVQIRQVIQREVV